MAERDGGGLAAAAQAARLDDPEVLRGLVHGALPAIPEAAMAAHPGAGRDERAAGRTGSRHGHTPRTPTTRGGPPELRGPPDRDGAFAPELFGRSQRHEQALVPAPMETCLQGGSTRKVAAVTEARCGTSFATSQVSALAGPLDAELAAWRERPLMAASYPSPTVGARDEHVRVAGRVVGQGVLVVAGGRDDGRREVLAVAVADTAREATYRELSTRLTARGRRGGALVPSDAHAGLRAAIARPFPGASWPRCQVPFARAPLGLVGRGHRARLAAERRASFAAPDAGPARAAARACAGRWRPSHPAVAARPEEELEAGLAGHEAPAAHRVRVRTANGLERFNRERKRRTRVARSFPNRAALLRPVTAPAMEQGEGWVSGRRCPDMERRWADQPRPAPAARAQAA